MKPLCEIIVQVVLPAVRALVAKDLIEKHGLTQQQAAERLGTTQPAISQYMRDLRGLKVKSLQKSKIALSEIEKLSSRIAAGEIAGDVVTTEFCKICKTLREQDIKTICDLHKEFSPSLEKCTVCLEKQPPC